MKNKKIGIYDSGYGGLTVLNQVRKDLPQYDYIYLGDNINSPYGDKGAKNILKYTKKALSFLFDQQCQLIIVACNTVSAVALREIQRHWLPVDKGQRVLGVLVPAVEELVLIPKDKNICVIGTTATTNALAYEKEFNKLLLKKGKKRNGIFMSLATPLLVPLIEKDKQNTKQMLTVIRRYAKKVVENNIDVLVLGCTHYPLIVEQIRKELPNKISIFNPTELIGKKLIKYLRNHPEIESQLSCKSKLVIYTTMEVGAFAKSVAQWVPEVEKHEIKKAIL